MIELYKYRFWYYTIIARVNAKVLSFDAEFLV